MRQSIWMVMALTVALVGCTATWAGVPVEIELNDGAVVVGEIQDYGQRQYTLTLEDGEQLTLSEEDIRAIRFVGKEAEAEATEPQLVRWFGTQAELEALAAAVDQHIAAIEASALQPGADHSLAELERQFEQEQRLVGVLHPARTAVHRLQEAVPYTELVYRIDEAQAVVGILEKRFAAAGIRMVELEADGQQLVVRYTPRTEAFDDRMRQMVERDASLAFKVVVPSDELAGEDPQHAIEALRQVQAGRAVEVGAPVPGLEGRLTWGELVTRYQAAPYTLAQSGEETWLLLRNPEAPVTQAHLSRVYPIRDSSGLPALGFELDAEGTERFARLTSKYQGQQLAIVLDGRVATVPVIRSPITGGRGIIEGDFTLTGVEDHVAALSVEWLPARPVMVEQRVVRFVLPEDAATLAGYEASLTGESQPTGPAAAGELVEAALRTSADEWPAIADRIVHHPQASDIGLELVPLLRREQDVAYPAFSLLQLIGDGRVGNAIIRDMLDHPDQGLSESYGILFDHHLLLLLMGDEQPTYVEGLDPALMAGLLSSDHPRLVLTGLHFLLRFGLPTPEVLEALDTVEASGPPPAAPVAALTRQLLTWAGDAKDRVQAILQWLPEGPVAEWIDRPDHITLAVMVALRRVARPEQAPTLARQLARRAPSVLAPMLLFELLGPGRAAPALVDFAANLPGPARPQVCWWLTQCDLDRTTASRVTGMLQDAEDIGFVVPWWQETWVARQAGTRWVTTTPMDYGTATRLANWLARETPPTGAATGLAPASADVVTAGAGGPGVSIVRLGRAQPGDREWVETKLRECPWAPEDLRIAVAE